MTPTFDVTHLRVQPFDELMGAGLPFPRQTIHGGVGPCEPDEERLPFDLRVRTDERRIDVHENVFVRLL
jgi:hypothetical protein